MPQSASHWMLHALSSCSLSTTAAHYPQMRSQVALTQFQFPGGGACHVLLTWRCHRTEIHALWRALLVTADKPAGSQGAGPADRRPPGEWARWRTWHKLVGKRQVQQARARRGAAAGHPYVGRLDIQVAQPARMHFRQRLRTGSPARALAITYLLQAPYARETLVHAHAAKAPLSLSAGRFIYRNTQPSRHNLTLNHPCIPAHFQQRDSGSRSLA